MSHRSQWTGAVLSLLMAAAGIACGGTRAAPKSPAAGAAEPMPPAASAPSAKPGGEPSAGAPGSTAHKGGSGEVGPNGTQNDAESEDDAELIVSRDVVAACPTLRLVRQHMGELDQDMVWLAVLESIGDCMSEGGAMERQNIGVSGDEEHRHIVREVLETHGVSPTRVVAKPQSVEGAAECQGGVSCGRRVEITILTP